MNRKFVVSLTEGRFVYYLRLSSVEEFRETLVDVVPGSEEYRLGTFETLPFLT